MKKKIIISILPLILSSCYNYVAFDPNNDPQILEKLAKDNIRSGGNLKDINSNNKLSNKKIRNNKNSTDNLIPEINLSDVKITDIIKPKQFYKIDIDNIQHSIEAKEWKADTLYAIEKGKPLNELKFHKDKISNVKIRKFSKAKSDALTATAYALGGFIIFLLLK